MMEIFFFSNRIRLSKRDAQAEIFDREMVANIISIAEFDAQIF